MVRAGFVGSEAAEPNRLRPHRLPQKAERLFKEARPEVAFGAVTRLGWGDLPRYYMFSRSVSQWNSAQV
jgi:hypothetical protein